MAILEWIWLLFTLYIIAGGDNMTLYILAGLELHKYFYFELTCTFGKSASLYSLFGIIIACLAKLVIYIHILLLGDII